MYFDYYLSFVKFLILLLSLIKPLSKNVVIESGYKKIFHNDCKDEVLVSVF